MHVWPFILQQPYCWMSLSVCTACTVLHLPPSVLPPCNYCHHPWSVGDKSYHKALLIVFSCDGMSDHASWNEVFHYWDTELSCPCSTSVTQHYKLNIQIYWYFDTFLVNESCLTDIVACQVHPVLNKIGPVLVPSLYFQQFLSPYTI